MSATFLQHELALQSNVPGYGGLAHSGECLACNQKVIGAKPISSTNFSKSISGIGALAARLFWEQDQACSIHASRTILCRGRMAMQLTVNQPHGGSIPPDTATWVASITTMRLPFKQSYLSLILRRPTNCPYSLTGRALLS